MPAARPSSEVRYPPATLRDTVGLSMSPPNDRDAKAAARLRTALELQRTGIALFRQSLVRRFPNESEAEVRARLSRWLRERPGAELGDGEGRPVPWPRPRG